MKRDKIGLIFIFIISGSPTSSHTKEDSKVSDLHDHGPHNEVNTHSTNNHMNPLLFGRFPDPSVGKNESKLSMCDASDGSYGGDIWLEGLIAIIVFYLMVLCVGVWAGWKNKGKEVNQEEVLLAGRDLGLFVGVLTMGATWVGGGFINGTAQGVYTKGLVWTQAPFGYALSLIIGGTFFAGKMRASNYVTMIDPFTNKYGNWGALMVIPAAISEIFWSAAILGALGSTLNIILHIEDNVSIILSAVIALCYTLFGGLVSVAYTDVVQIFFVAVGLFIALPFALVHPAVKNLYNSETGSAEWYGYIAPHEVGEWIDTTLLSLLGGIPWQCYFQRVLSAKTSMRAQFLSYGGAAIALIMAGPSVLFGAIAKSTDWSLTYYPCGAPEGDSTKLVVPLSLQYLTPPVVAWFGLGAISAAVMSSTDSSMLSASSLVARNIYHKVLRPSSSDREVIVVLWLMIICNCVIATTLAIQYKNIYALFVLCGDFAYVMLFPQLLLVLYWSKANTYGSLASFIVTLILRLLAGDKYLGLPSVLTFGSFNGYCFNVEEESLSLCDEGGEMPFRTIIMLISLVVHILVSGLTYYTFCLTRVSLDWDVLNCFHVVHGGILVELKNTREMASPLKSLKDFKEKLDVQAKYVGKYNKRKNVVTVM